MHCAGPLGVSLEPPTDGRPYYLVRNSLASLVKEIEGDRTVIKVFLGLFGGLGLLVSSWAAWKLYRRGLAAREARLNTDRSSLVVTTWTCSSRGSLPHVDV